jgi:uncharacterized protein
MKINISNLSEGIHEYNLESTVEEVGLENPFNGVVRATVILEKSLQQVSLRVSAHCNRNFECDRCIKEFESTIDTEFRSIYAWEERDNTPGEDEEYHILPSGINIIDISPEVREFLLLAIPWKILCKEDCKGLCPSCGVNWNEKECECSFAEVNDRWSALKKLKSSEN